MVCIIEVQLEKKWLLAFSDYQEVTWLRIFVSYLFGTFMNYLSGSNLKPYCLSLNPSAATY